MSKTKRTVSLDEAAAILAISPDALRKRIKRGTVEASKDEAGRWRLMMDDDRTDGLDNDQKMSGHVQALQATIELLKQQIESKDRELERRDTLMMTLMQRIPQLEAPKDKRSFLDRLFRK